MHPQERLSFVRRMSDFVVFSAFAEELLTFSSGHITFEQTFVLSGDIGDS
jgi:hypothetical protein